MRERSSKWITAAVLGLCAAGASLGGCAKNEATGRWQLIAMSVETAIATGEEMAPQFTEQYGGEVADSVATGYVREIGEKLAATTEGDNPTLPWRFTLLDSDVINAFALPGGKVFVSRGLAARMRNEAQLAGVIGHEIGHVTARHVNDRMSQAYAKAGGEVIVEAVLQGRSDAIQQVAGEAYGLISGGAILAWGREQELESDELGMRYMSRVGYNPRGQRQVMQILAEATGGGERGSEWQSTHPYPETRIEKIDALLNSTYAEMSGTADGFFASRYEQNMLSRVGRIEASLGDPVHWCAVCAAGDAEAEIASAD